MNLENLNLVELNAQEQKEVDGGFLPLIVVYACWGVMLACSAVAVGLRDGAAAK
jgi:lactobin A/cerein 7B family class IIb bacteriocin